MGESQKALQESDLIFPSASSSIRDTLGALKRSNLTTSNRLRSIYQDAKFVQKAAEVYQLPLIANERCGSWYIDPNQKAGSAYFKSTDGHFGQWSVSLRRLNLNILEIVGQHGGCIIVDSTRRGKSMPDALSKTIPIWIATINRLLFPEKEESHSLHTPSEVVSESEHSQIEERLASAVQSFQSLQLDVAGLRVKLSDKPLRPHWATSGIRSPEKCPLSDRDQYHPVVLCTASGSTSEPSHNINGYVQGAADDHESWAHGLDAVTFWKYSEKLLATSEEELPDLVKSLMDGVSTEQSVRNPILISPTSTIWIADNTAAQACSAHFDIVVSCRETPDSILADELKTRYLHLTCTDGKIGSRQLRAELSKLESLPSLLGSNSRILVACENGKDLSVGLALAIICLHCLENGSLVATPEAGVLAAPNKTMIKHRLSWIMVCIPDAKPSRATLQSVNAFLMG